LNCHDDDGQQVVFAVPQFVAHFEHSRRVHADVLADRPAVQKEAGGVVDALEMQLHPPAAQALVHGERLPVHPGALGYPLHEQTVALIIRIRHFTVPQEVVENGARHRSLPPPAHVRRVRLHGIPPNPVLADKILEQPVAAVQIDPPAHRRSSSNSRKFVSVAGRFGSAGMRSVLISHGPNSASTTRFHFGNFSTARVAVLADS